MKKISFISCILCFAILNSSFSMLGVSAAAEDEAVAVKTFEAEWKKLVATKTELLATPNTADSACNATVDSTELTDEEKAAFGEYYYHITDGKKKGYSAAGGSFKDYSGKENVQYYFSYKLIFNGGGSNFEVKFYDFSWGADSIWPYAGVSNTLKNSSFGASSLNGRDVRRTAAIEVEPNGKEVYIGCIYVSYDEAIAMPEGYESFGAEDWLNAVYATDLSDYTVTDEFKAAFAVLQGYTEEGSKILALKNAFGNLKITKTELLVTPKTADSACKTTADSTELTDEEKTAFGDYYYHITDGSGKDYIRTGGKDYSDKQNVKYSFSYKLIFNGSGSNFEIKCYDASWNMGSIWPYTSANNKLQSFTFDASNVGGKDIRNTPAISINPNGNEIYIGCIYVSYDEAITLPEGYELFSAEDWINTVYATDFSDYTVTDEFKAAFADLQGCTEEGSKVLALKNAFSNLKTTQTELLAAPDTADSACKTTADSTELTDEEKAAFGEYYYHITDGIEKGYKAAGETFKDYSDKENVKYSFSCKLIFDGDDANYQVKFYDATYIDGSDWPYTTAKNTLMTRSFNADSIGGRDVRKAYGISVNPNGKEVYMGCIYVSYDEPIALPKGCEFFSAEDWVNTVYATDLSTCTVTEEFKAAFAALKEDNILARADINEDYSFNATDMAVLRQRLLGVDSDNYNFDLNGDGHSDICDLIRIKRMLCDRKR